MREAENVNIRGVSSLIAQSFSVNPIASIDALTCAKIRILSSTVA